VDVVVDAEVGLGVGVGRKGKRTRAEGIAEHAGGAEAELLNVGFGEGALEERPGLGGHRGGDGGAVGAVSGNMGDGAFALDEGGGVEEWIEWEMLIRGFGADSPGGAYCRQ